MIELIGNLQTYELGLARVGKGSKGKNMALKTKNDDNDESFEDEHTKLNLISPDNLRSLSKM